MAFINRAFYDCIHFSRETGRGKGKKAYIINATSGKTSVHEWNMYLIERRIKMKCNLSPFDLAKAPPSLTPSLHSSNMMFHLQSTESSSITSCREQLMVVHAAQISVRRRDARHFSPLPLKVRTCAHEGDTLVHGPLADGKVFVNPFLYLR